MRQPRLAVMPVVGRPGRTRFNVVPRDFVVEAIAYLSARPETRGGVYALADPRPLTVDEILRELAHVTGRTVLRVPLPRWLAKDAIDHLPGVFSLLRIPSSAVDYFVLPTTFDTRHAQEALAAGGIRCPPFRRYLPRLVAFMRTHGEVGAPAMT